MERQKSLVYKLLTALIWEQNKPQNCCLDTPCHNNEQNLVWVIIKSGQRWQVDDHSYCSHLQIFVAYSRKVQFCNWSSLCFVEGTRENSFSGPGSLHPIKHFYTKFQRFGHKGQVLHCRHALRLGGGMVAHSVGEGVTSHIGREQLWLGWGWHQDQWWGWG